MYSVMFPAFVLLHFLNSCFANKRNYFRFVLLLVVMTFFFVDAIFSQWQRFQEAEMLHSAVPSVEWVKFNDCTTGHEVIQMTSSEHGTWATHFNTTTVTPDDRYLVFSSDRTGNWQLYRASLENGEILQLTDVNSLANSSFTMHPNGTEALFGFDGKLGRVNIITGEIRKAEFDVPVTFRRLVSNDGKYSVVTHTSEGSLILLISLSLPEVVAELNWPRGTTLSPGITWTGRISHTMMNPEYPWLVTFLPVSTYREETQYFDHQRDMSLPMKLRARAWLWDARTGEASPFVSAPLHYSYTHEAWCRTGERFFLFQKSAPGWVPNHISSVDRDGNDWQYHHSDDTLRLGHGSPSYDGKWFVSDGQDPGRNPIRLINLETGRWEDLCWPDASISPGHSQQAHVHPSFSSSGNYIVFTSDRTGSSEAYVIKVPRQVKLRLKQSIE